MQITRAHRVALGGMGVTRDPMVAWRSEAA